MTGLRPFALALAPLALVWFAAAARADGLDFASQQGLPVEVYADNGMELSQDAKTVIARGHAKAIRGRVTVIADMLTAHYRDKAKPGTAVQPAAAKGTNEGDTGNTEVWRLEADGHVVIFTDTQRAYGDHADYNIDDAVVVLTGKDLHMDTATEVVTARDSLEYWEKRLQAVARGDAVASKEDKRIRADILVADYAQDKDKKTVLRHATGFDHVIITTPTEIVTGNRADYDPQTAIVTVAGNVKMTRDKNQLEGEYAVVNLNTGISKIFPTLPGAASSQDSRVKALLVPDRSAQPANPGASATGGAAAPAPPPLPPAAPRP